jgi:flavin reductase (DIM6/NTAB) family NADH-FMN oxidoreductase RutF
VKDQEVQEFQKRKRWRMASELPADVLKVLRKPNRAINPVAIVATVDPDGTPRTAPFGSTRAVTPQLLRMISLHYHDTFANLSRDGRVMVALVAPPNVAVSIRGRARVVRERMHADERSAILEIDVEEVKNDMVRGSIGSAITFFPEAEHQAWFDAALGEVEEM